MLDVHPVPLLHVPIITPSSSTVSTLAAPSGLSGSHSLETQTSSEPPPPVPPQSPLSPEIEQSKPPDPVKKKPVIESVSSQSDQVLDSKETSEKVDEPTISPVVLRRKKSSADDDVFNQSFEHDKSFSGKGNKLDAVKLQTGGTKKL